MNGGVDKPNFIQTVIRDERPGKTIFRFDLEALEHLGFNDIQRSFLLVHEWLWQYCDSVRSIRDINHFLHSWELDRISSSELPGLLRDLGLNIQSDGESR